MEQEQDFWQKYRNYFIFGIVAVLLVIFFANRSNQPNNDKKSAQDEQQTEQNQAENNQNPDKTEAQKKDEEAKMEADKMAADKKTTEQNNTNGATITDVQLTGTLNHSNKPEIGNWVVESDQGQIFVNSNKDYSELIGKPVNLSASGNINSFTNAIITTANAKVASDKPSQDTPTIDKNNSTSVNLSSNNFIVNGTLMNSDNQSIGNYVINSDQGNIQFKSVHDYSNLIGKQITLSANGDINSFTNGIVTAK